jgi:hypothetical protein
MVKSGDSGERVNCRGEKWGGGINIVVEKGQMVDLSCEKGGEGKLS